MAAHGTEGMPHSCLATITAWLPEARAAAEAASAADAARITQRRREYYAKISEGQAPRLHKETKPIPVHTIGPSPRHSARGQPKLMCKAKLEWWSEIWRVAEHDLQQLQPWLDEPGDDEQLPDITAANVEESCRKFKANTGLGADKVHPRVYSDASQEIRQATADLLMSVERSLCWPQQIQLLLCILLMRPGGGDRPVFIMPSLIRLWEKIRLPIMKKWAATMARTYDWAAEGRSSVEAAWWQLLQAEALDAGDGPEAEGMITVLIDVVKCFDRVQLRHVWKWGVTHGMPKRLLRLVLVTYSMARRISMMGTISEEVVTSTAVVPGSALALFILHAVLVTPCDDLLRAHQRLGLNCSIGLAKFVDDLAVSAVGVSKHAQQIAMDAYDWLAKHLKEELDMEVSVDTGRGKTKTQGNTVVLVSNSWLQARLSESVSARGLRLSALAKNLGIEQRGVGRRKGIRVGEQRVRAVERRRLRIAFAKRNGAAVHRVAKAGLKAAAT